MPTVLEKAYYNGWEQGEKNGLEIGEKRGWEQGEKNGLELGRIEGRIEARKENEEAARKAFEERLESIAGILCARFTISHDDAIKIVDPIQDASIINDVIVSAAVCSTLDDFVVELNKRVTVQ